MPDQAAARAGHKLPIAGPRPDLQQQPGLEIHLPDHQVQLLLKAHHQGHPGAMPDLDPLTGVIKLLPGLPLREAPAAILNPSEIMSCKALITEFPFQLKTATANVGETRRMLLQAAILMAIMVQAV